MSGGEHAGPSRCSERSKKPTKVSEQFCGLSEAEVRSILQGLEGENLYLSDEEPFLDSGSEYEVESDSEDEVSLESLAEELLEDENETENPIRNEDTNESEDEMDLQATTSNVNPIKWKLKEFVPSVFEFDDNNSGVKTNNLPNQARELDYFVALFDHEIVNVIIENTNLYAQQQKTKNWKQLDKLDFFVFLALTMLMPHTKKTDIKNYWSKDILIATPFFRNAMSRDRYLAILRNLHFQNNEQVQTPKPRLYKMGPVVDLIKKNFAKLLYPFQNLVVDESMILFKGRLLFKQYIKTKRHRFGIKLFVLCDCETAYVLDFIVYVGKEDDPNRHEEFGLSGKTVLTLLKPYLNKGHSLYSDNFYTSPTLSVYLWSQKTNSCGTVRTNRKGMPKFERKLKKGETEFRSSDYVMALKWKDRREVHMLTTMHDNEMVTLSKKDRATNEFKRKPACACVVDYNEKMGAVDKTDMMISSVDCTRKTVKWYKKLFFHSLDLCMLNAHAMYLTQNSNKVPFPKFHLEVVRQLLERYPPKEKRASYNQGLARISERHFPDMVPRKNGKAQFRRCKVCSQTEKREKKRKNTRYMCVNCDVGLCITPCFRIYHEEARY